MRQRLPSFSSKRRESCCSPPQANPSSFFYDVFENHSVRTFLPTVRKKSKGLSSEAINLSWVIGMVNKFPFLLAT